jgi:hypothetical protein
MEDLEEFEGQDSSEESVHIITLECERKFREKWNYTSLYI